MFNANIYRLFNPEFKSLNKNQLFIHWKTIGKNHKKISSFEDFFKVYPEFDKKLYLHIYPELENKDDLVIMIHYHNNNNKNDLLNQIEKSKSINNNSLKYFSILNELFINKYYKFKVNYCYFISEYQYTLNKLFIDSLKNKKSIIYIFGDFKNKTENDQNENLQFIPIKNNFQIQYFIQSLNYDYIIFIDSIHDQIINHSNYLDNLKYLPNILFYQQNNSKLMILKKKLFNYYYYSYNLYKTLINNSFLKCQIINNEITESYKFKFFSIDQSIEKIKKLIQQQNNIYPIQFNYCIDQNIFINFFKELLFLDFKKPVIMIYIDTIISETFIINALINLDFQNSIIIIGGNVESIDKYPFLKSFSYITTKELYDHFNKNNNKITIMDYEFMLGYMLDHFIGCQNEFNLLLNKIFDHILFYTDINIHLFQNQNNVQLFNDLPLILENKIVKKYSNYYLIHNQNLNVLNYENYYFDYYVNDYILKMLSTQIINYEKNNINFNYSKYFGFIEYNNEYYLNYFNLNQKINKNDCFYNFLKNNKNIYKSEKILNKIQENCISAVNSFILIFLIEKIEDYYYLESQLNKLNLNDSVKIELFIYENENKIEIKQTSDHIQLNYMKYNNINEVINILNNKFTYTDIFIFYYFLSIKPINLNYIVNQYINQKNLYFEYQYFIIFNLFILYEYQQKEILINLLIKKTQLNQYNINNIFYLKKNQSHVINLKNIIQDEINQSMINHFLYTQDNQDNYQQILDYINFNDDVSLTYNINNNCLNINEIEYKIELNDLINILDNYIEDECLIKIIFYDLNDIILKKTIDKESIFVDYNNNLVYLILKIRTLKNIHYFKINKSNKKIYNQEIFYYILNYKYKIEINKLLKTGFKQIKLNELNIQDLNYYESIQIESYLNYKKFIYFTYTNNIYDHILDIVIINLKNRYDKKEYIERHLNELGILNYKIFNAFKLKKEELQSIKYIKSESFLNHYNIDYVLGASGCKKSHFTCIQQVDQYKKYTLILEDDVILEKNIMVYIFNALQQLSDFDLLYLGANIKEKNDAHLVKPNILKVNQPKTTTAYIIKNNNTQKLLNIIENSTNEIDDVYGNEELEKYCIYPMVAHQKNIKSDIVNNNFYGNYHEKFSY